MPPNRHTTAAGASPAISRFAANTLIPCAESMVTPGRDVRAGTAKNLATVAVIQRHRHPNRRRYSE